MSRRDRRRDDARPQRLSRLLIAHRIGGPAHAGRLIAGDLVLPCALGRSALSSNKREGDGATPRGRRRLVFFFFRPGRVSRAGVSIPARALRPQDLWCDDAASPLYNRFLRGRTRFSHEALWRDDALYDVIGVLDYNLRPIVRGRGSAIFFHLAQSDLAPTAGCVALRPRDMARLLPRLAKGAALAAG
jgi:L,D-peptidoglycan transpeptidase YkuD (ErfK/YbiS/YcfS/YnhG family)